MNIFFLDKNPELCAQYHCDKHVIKMIVETAQMLSTVHHIVGTTEEFEKEIYKKTHENHPCSMWARSSYENYVWLCNLGMSLCREYTLRYGKIHKTQKIMEVLDFNVPALSEDGFTQFPVLIQPGNIRFESDFDTVVEMYRQCYITDKSKFATWKIRNIPEWFKIN